MADNYNAQVKQYLKRNEKNLYREYRGSLSDPVALVNQLVRHYQWIYEIQDFRYLDLQDRANKNYLNLFLYGLERSDELASDFINYFVFSFRNAFDIDTRTWNIDLIFNTFIHQCSYHEFDLIAMYSLIGATFDRFTKFIIKMKIEPKLNMTLKDVVAFFELIINQKFYEELKTEIYNKRKNSYYFKAPDIQVYFPKDRVIEPWEHKRARNKTTVRKTFNKKELEMLKNAQANAELEFEKWENAATDLDPDMIDAGARKDNTKNAIPYAHNPGDILKGRTNYQGSPNDGSRDIEIPDIMKAKEVDETPEVIEEAPVEKKKVSPVKMIKLTVGPISQQQRKK